MTFLSIILIMFGAGVWGWYREDARRLKEIERRRSMGYDR